MFNGMYGMSRVVINTHSVIQTISRVNVYCTNVDTFTTVSEVTKGPCIFCSDDHYNDECDVYRSLVDCKQKLQMEDCCFVCVKVAHI